MSQTLQWYSFYPFPVKSYQLRPQSVNNFTDSENFSHVVSQDQSRIRVINATCLLGLVVVLFVNLTLYITGEFYFINFLIFCFAFLCPLVANYFSFYTLARFLIYICGLIAISYTVIVTPDKIVYFVIPIIVLPYFFHEALYRTILLSLTLIVPIILVLYLQLDFSFPHHLRPLFFLVSLTTSIVFLIKFAEIKNDKTVQNQNLLKGISDQKVHLAKKENELNEINRKLSLQNQELENFVYIASHDLKQPIRNTISYVQLLKKKLSKIEGKPLDKSNADQLELLETNALSINKLIQNLLKFSRIGKSGKPTVFKLEPLVEACYNSIKESEQNNFGFQSDCDVEVFGRKADIQILIHELILNAVKANSDKEDLFVEFKACNYDQSVLCTIEDNGAGVPEDQLGYIQDIFNKVDETDGGSGVGTAICQKVIASHNGNIYYKKSEQGGLKVAFSFNLNSDEDN